MIVVGIAGVVGVLVAMLAMGEGFRATLQGTGRDDTAIVLRGGSQAETNSAITRDQPPLIANLPGIARDADGRPLLSPELSQVVNMVLRDGGTEANAQIRGVGEMAWRVRPHVRITAGRRFETGKRELVVGRGAANQYRNLEVGSRLRLAGRLQAPIMAVHHEGRAMSSSGG